MSFVESEDCAWVTIQVPFGTHALQSWLHGPETLFRINSLLEISDWRQEDEHRVQLRGRNLGNGRALDLDLDLKASGNRLVVYYSEGLKRSTSFVVEPAEGGGAQLRITDDYSGWSEGERRARLDEVDRSLPQWGQDLYLYFKRWNRWSWLAPWRWYVTRVWIPMRPSARRITRWLFWIAIAELVAFLVVFAVFLLEQSR